MTRNRTLIIVLMMMLVAGCGSSGAPSNGASNAPGESGAVAWEPEWVDGVLQPLPDGFPNQPITLLNTDGPGDRDGIFARNWQTVIRDMSPVAIEVADRPDIGGTVSGTWYGLQYMSQQEGGDEGYIVQAAQIVGGGLDILSTTAPDELEMTIDDLNTVIGTEYTPLVLTQRKDPPWGSTDFDDMVAYVREHPGEVEYICLAPGSGRDIAWASYAAELELEFKEPWVCGEGSDGIAAIIGAGEGDLALNTPGAALIGVESDRMDVIFQAGTVPAETGPWVGVPTGADVLGEKDPWGFLGGWAVTGAVPELHRQWLHELFRVAGETDELQELRQALPGTVIVSLDHDESTQVLLDALEEAKPILQELEMCVGAQCS